MVTTIAEATELFELTKHRHFTQDLVDGIKQNSGRAFNRVKVIEDLTKELRRTPTRLEVDNRTAVHRHFLGLFETELDYRSYGHNGFNPDLAEAPIEKLLDKYDQYHNVSVQLPAEARQDAMEIWTNIRNEIIRRCK